MLSLWLVLVEIKFGNMFLPMINLICFLVTEIILRYEIKFDELWSSIVRLSLRKACVLLVIVDSCFWSNWIWCEDSIRKVMIIGIIIRFYWEWNSSSHLLCMIIIIIIIFWHEWYSSSSWYNKCDNCHFDDNLEVVTIVM
jgi:hypothetical protein